MSANISMTAKLIQDDSDQIERVREAFAYLAEHQAYIGIPQEANTAHEGGAVTLAELLFIHENGSPARGIPARPVLDESILHNQEQVLELTEAVVRSAMEGNLEAVKKGIERLGLFASGKAKAYFNEANGWAPNAPSTIKQKGSSRPLVHEGTMKKAITHVVDKKGRDSKR